LPFITLSDGRRIFVKNQRAGITIKIQDIYGPEIAADPKVQRAGTFEQAQIFARERAVRGGHQTGGIGHNISFISPEKAEEQRKRLEKGKGETELREIIGRNPDVIKFGDELFKKRLEERVVLEKKQASSNVVLDRVILKAEEAKEKSLNQELKKRMTFFPELKKRIE